MLRFIPALIVAFSSVLVGCVQVEEPKPYSYGVVQSGDFSLLESSAKTYAWLPDTGLVYSENSASDNRTTSHLFAEKIEQVLQEKGYRRVSSVGMADFLVAYGLASDEALNDDQVFKRTRLSTGIEQFSYDGENANQKGSFAVAMYTQNGSLPFWRGLVQGASNMKMSDEEIDARAYQVVSSVFSQLPQHQVK